ncbi:MAG: histidine ammonia-lyase [Gammaproteobacteria bacterium]|nr:histidine ammonia-lyase [Gammaproteobacteria bacterium]
MTDSKEELILTPGTTSLSTLFQILEQQELSITLDRQCKRAVDNAAAVVAKVISQDTPVYGVNTGFGKLASVQIAEADATTLQRNLILSHCAGVGESTDITTTRLMMALKLLSLGRGASGVRWKLINAIEALLHEGITPVVPLQGSVGASGDLAPLAHFAAALMGEGDAFYQGSRQAAGAALQRAGLKPIQLIAKEGLALINGTQFSTANALVALYKAQGLAATAVVTSAMSTDAIMGSTAPLQPEIHQLRGLQGQIEVAASMRALMQGSEIRNSHRHGDTRVQDPYCIRCQPQVTGACISLLRQAAETLQTEANAVTDNPLVIVDSPADIDGTAVEGRVLSGGNFHAEPVAFAADQIALAIAELGAIAQRRVALMVDPALSFDLPPFLTPDPGLCSGFMVAEITTAALMSENKHLANPCSTDSTPTSANQEDHVSMAAHGAVRLARMNANLSHILAVELLCAARGIEFRAPLTTSAPLQSVIAALRAKVTSLQQDRYMTTDIEAAATLIDNGNICQACHPIELPALTPRIGQ